MMIAFKTKCSLFILACCAPLLAQQDSSVAKVVAMKVTPYFAEARPGLLPRGYVNQGDTCLMLQAHVDSLGAPWFELKRDEQKIWSSAKNWQYVSDIVDEEVSAARKQSDADRKRRLRILQKHRDWPRRIIRLVREGEICLDMTAEQLAASWGEPLHKSRAFTVGLGEHEFWIFSGEKGRMPVVSLRNGRIIGWSLSK